MYMVPSSICSISYEDIEYEQLSFKIHINPVLTNQYLNSDLCLYFFLRQGTIFFTSIISDHVMMTETLLTFYLSDSVR